MHFFKTKVLSIQQSNNKDYMVRLSDVPILLCLSGYREIPETLFLDFVNSLKISGHHNDIRLSKQRIVQIFTDMSVLKFQHMIVTVVRGLESKKFEAFPAREIIVQTYCSHFIS